MRQYPIKLIIASILASFIAISNVILFRDQLPLILNSILSNIIYGIALIIGLPVIVRASIKLYKTKQKPYLTPLFILITSLCFIMIFTFYYQKLDNSPTLLAAKHSEDIAGNIYMELKENGNYRIDYYSFLDGSRYRGRYRIIEDTIFLSEEKPVGPNEKNMTNKLLMKENIIYYYSDENGNYNEDMTMTIVWRR